MILRAAMPSGGEFSSSTVPLVPSHNVANLRRIVCNALEPVVLRMLVCKDERVVEEIDACSYPDHRNNEATKLACNDCKNELAQIYIRLERVNDSRSCVIAFVEGQYLSQIDDLLARLQYSVLWLDIKRERPYFYIFYYGQPMAQLATNNSSKHINDRIKEIFDFYPKEEETCIVAPVGRHSESLIINHRKKFSCKAS
jgi:hypothetical protein